MKALESLAEKETALYRVVEAQTGLIEEKVASLAALGVLRANEEILQAYLGLLPDPEAGLEALKRAVFLAWIGCLEPPALTGIRMSPQPVEATLASLGRAFEAGRVDSELRWMVLWYHHLADFFFTALDRYPRLRDHLSRGGVDANGPPAELRCGHGERGQMSQYWKSIADSKARRLGANG